MKIKKNILTIITISLVVLVIFLSFFIFRELFFRKNCEKSFLEFADKNQSPVFSITNITLFSSADAQNKTNTANSFTLQNLYQYTDIALFIKNFSDEKNLENTLKKVSIDNIKISKSTNCGNANLYFKSINNFAKSELVSDNIINNSFEFNISSDDNADLNTPILYNNLANPLTFSYINQNIKSDYTITDISSPITYDGSLLKKCNINLEDLACSISFDVNITNNLDQCFKTNVFFNIPLSSDAQSIYDGNIIQKNTTNYVFYRYK